MKYYNHGDDTEFCGYDQQILYIQNLFLRITLKDDDDNAAFTVASIKNMARPEFDIMTSSTQAHDLNWIGLLDYKLVLSKYGIIST
jgi:hypothetical protein